MLYIKGLFALFLLYSSFLMYTIPMKWLFIQNANLIFHEAGHFIFIFFGNLISILGGTITELAIPLVATVHFLIYRQIFSAGFGLWWFSTALYSVSIYASDARTQLLPLLGGDSVVHDWNTILNTLNLIRYDVFIGNLFLAFSILALMGACYLFYFDMRCSFQKRDRSHTT